MSALSFLDYQYEEALLVTGDVRDWLVPAVDHRLDERTTFHPSISLVELLESLELTSPWA